MATELLLKDLSTDAGGGSDDDEIPEGPVVDENVHVVIYESGSTTNLLGTSTPLKTDTTYKVLLWSDKNSNGTYDTGEDVTSQYDYRWKFMGTSAKAGTGAGGIVNESWNDKDLVIPLTNAEAKEAFEGAEGGVTVGSDGVQGLWFVHRLQTQISCPQHTTPRGEWYFPRTLLSRALSKVG
ncbi:membrane protein [Salmonella enterica subsp. enterica]|uniref:Membrane protein n=1 Tax=Salmonella enterica I TaxID=59201 RepID=A0A379VMK9_SALET|nr:membrane protein [Salmonella enterica subsp. enterica]